jgi:hypothetical protein
MSSVILFKYGFNLKILLAFYNAAHSSLEYEIRPDLLINLAQISFKRASMFAYPILTRS